MTRPDRTKARIRGPAAVSHADDLRRRCAWGAVLVLLAILAYGRAVGGGFVWDDDDYVSENASLKEPGGIVPIWTDLSATPQYYPLVFTGFWLEYRVWGLNPAGYHITNLLLHGLAAVLLWRVLLRLELPGAWLAAAIFAVHPVHVESVAWITERKNVLSGVFVLAGLLAWMRWAQLPCAAAASPRTPSGQGKSFYLLSLVCFAAALLSKTAVSPLPVVLLVLIWWKRGRIERRDLLSTVPFFLLAIGSSLMTIHVEHGYTTWLVQESDYYAFAPLERILLAGRVLWFYAGKLLWPATITFVYPRWQIDAHTWWLYLYPATVIATLACLWLLRHRIGRGPLAAALVFIVMCAPVMGLIDMYYMRYSLVADHFQYLPSIALIAALAVLAALVRQRFQKRLPSPFSLPGILATVLLLVLAARSSYECGKFQSIKALWHDTIRKNPGAWLAHNNLGELLKREGDLDGAIRELSEGIRLNPVNPRSHFNLADIFISRQQYELAAAHLRIGIRSMPDDPRPELNLANCLFQQGDFAGAAEHCQRSIQLSPRDQLPRLQYARMLIQQGRGREAAMQLRAALKADPGWPPAERELAWILATHPDETVRSGLEALELARHGCTADRSDPRCPDMIAAALAETGRCPEAAALLREWLPQLPPDFPARAALEQRLALYERNTPFRDTTLKVNP